MDAAQFQVSAEESLAAPLPPATVELPHAVRALSNRDFRWFWSGNFLSNIGTWMQNVAQGWLVLQLTNSAFWLGVIGFAASAPMLVFTLIGGVMADRIDRRRMIMRTQSAMMIFAFILAILTWLKVIDVHMIVLLAFANGVAMSLNTPAYQALVPELVPKEDLTNAIALNSAQFNMSRVLGPTLGGFAMAWFGVAGNFFLNAISFVAVLIALTQIHFPKREEINGAGWWEDLAQGFRYLYEQREMKSLVQMLALASILGIPYIMFVPYFARDLLGLGERGLGLLMAANGAGAFLGAAALAMIRKIQRRGRFVMNAGAAFFLSIIAFSLSTRVWLSALMLAAAGCSMVLMVATVNALLQHLSSNEMRARVMSIYAAAFLGFAPIGALIAGSLSGAFGAPRTIAGMSAIALVGSVGLYFSRPELRCLK